jgi:hypothetical protein
VEPQKRARHSEALEPDELMESRMQPYSSSEDEDNTKETEVTFRARRAGDSPNIFDFTGPPNGVNRSAASDINAEISPSAFFILFFRKIFQIILDDTNRYLHQYMASKNKGSTSTRPLDVTIEQMYTFFTLVIQMGHDQNGSLKDYCSRQEQYCTPFYSNVMARDGFLHVLRFLHFENNEDPPNRHEPNYDRL